MALRSALSENWFVTIPVLAFLGWVLLKSLAVYDLLAGAAAAAVGVQGAYIGPSFVAGAIGLVVMAVVALLFLGLYSELGETSPAPSPWPPEE